MEDPVRAAEAELERACASASDEACVLALARAWALFPSSLIAHATVTLGRSLPHAAIEAETQHEIESAWHALADTRDPKHLPVLLATPWNRRPKDASRRLEKLNHFPRDPRIVDHLLELDTGERFLTPAGAQFWKDAWTLMLEWGSVDAARRLPREAPLHAVMPWEATRWSQIFDDVVRSWAGRLPPEPELTAPMIDSFTRLGDRVHAIERDVGGLVNAVFASPDDDSLRLVLADALTERGENRGDFITLQYANERAELTQTKRDQMESLLAAAGRRWFDGLLGQVSSRAIFRRGFLAEVQLAKRDPDGAARAWRLVEALDCAGLAFPLGYFLRHDNLRRVRRLFHVRAETLIHLLREGAGLSFELVEVRPPFVRPLPVLACRVDTLRLRDDASNALRWFTQVELSHHVKHVELDARPETLSQLESLLVLLETPGCAAHRVSFCCDGGAWPRPWGGEWEAHFIRGEDGRFSSLELVLHHRLVGLEGVLANLSPTRLVSASLTTSHYLPPAERTLLDALLAPQVKRQRKLPQLVSNLKVVQKRPVPPVVHDGR